jgi:transposase-like protein
MVQLSYRRHRFPAEIIQHAIWLYLRFTLSYRDVEELLAERGLDVSYETVRRWVLKFGPLIARKLRQGRPRPSARWHLDEMVVRIAGKRMYLWRAVDHEGEVLDMLVQRRRDTQAALRLMRKLLKKLGFAPKLLVTDKLGSYSSAFRQLRLTCPTSEASETIIALKTPIKLCGDESARCSGSSRLDPPSAFSMSIPLYTTPSTINDISSLGRRFGSSGPKQPPSGKLRLRPHEIGVQPRQFFPFAGYRDNAAKDIKVGFANINAKAEGIETRPAFRQAFERRRCLVPVDNFYEWKKTGTGKQPYAIALADRGIMALAGLWENWKSPAGEWMRSFAIVTTEPNELCADYITACR